MEQSDVRHRFEIRSPGEDPEDPYDYEVTARVVIRVNWSFDPCPRCGAFGQIPNPNWVVSGPGKTYNAPGEHSAFAIVEDAWPEAVAEERDPDWESERQLRIAEGWGCAGDWPRY